MCWLVLACFLTQQPPLFLSAGAGSADDDLKVWAAVFNALLHIHADAGDWKKGLQLLDEAVREMPHTEHRLWVLPFNTHRCQSCPFSLAELNGSLNTRKTRAGGDRNDAEQSRADFCIRFVLELVCVCVCVETTYQVPNNEFISKWRHLVDLCRTASLQHICVYIHSHRNE